MRLLRVRLTIRRLMIAVAITALLCIAMRQCRDYLLSMSLRKLNPNPIMRSVFLARAARHDGYATGQGVPILLDYDFKLSPPKLPSGMTFKLRAETWVEDQLTGADVDRYTFDRNLTPGGIETCLGKETWNAKVTRPGEYGVCYRLSYMDPWGWWRELCGGKSMIIRVK